MSDGLGFLTAVYRDGRVHIRLPSGLITER
mgnify:CR=1 FL=1